MHDPSACSEAPASPKSSTQKAEPDTPVASYMQILENSGSPSPLQTGRLVMQSSVETRQTSVSAPGLFLQPFPSLHESAEWMQRFGPTMSSENGANAIPSAPSRPEERSEATALRPGLAAMDDDLAEESAANEPDSVVPYLSSMSCSSPPTRFPLRFCWLVRWGFVGANVNDLAAAMLDILGFIVQAASLESWCCCAMDSRRKMIKTRGNVGPMLHFPCIVGVNFRSPWETTFSLSDRRLLVLRGECLHVTRWNFQFFWHAVKKSVQSKQHQPVLLFIWSDVVSNCNYGCRCLWCSTCLRWWQSSIVG